MTLTEAQIAALVAQQADNFQNLDKILKNIPKLPVAKRDDNHYATYWNQAKAFWENFVKIHHQLLESGWEIPETYLERVHATVQVFQNIKTLIIEYKPGMMNYRKNEQEVLANPPTQNVTQPLPEVPTTVEEQAGANQPAASDQSNENNDNRGTSSEVQPPSKVELPPVSTPLARPLEPNVNTTPVSQPAVPTNRDWNDIMDDEQRVRAPNQEVSPARMMTINNGQQGSGGLAYTTAPISQQGGYNSLTLPAGNPPHQAPVSGSGVTNPTYMQYLQNQRPLAQSVSQPHQPINLEQGSMQQPLYQSGAFPAMQANGTGPTDIASQALLQLTNFLNGSNASNFNRKQRKLELEEFKGDVLTYQTFKQTFKVISEREKLDKMDQLILLRAKVKGEAMEDLPRELSEAALEQAWANLDHRYLRDQEILASTIRKFMTAAKPNSSAESVLDMIRCHQQAAFELKNLGVDAMDILRFFAIESMSADRSFRFKTLLGQSGARPTAKQFDGFLETEYNLHLKQKNQVQINVSPSGKPPTTRSPEQHPRSRNQMRTNTHFSSTDNRSPGQHETRRPLTRFLCSASHVVKECPKLLQAENREQLLRSCKICIYCMKHRYDHRKPCKGRDKLRCEMCGANHIKELHDTPSKLPANPEQVYTHFNQNEAYGNSTILLPTAIIGVITASRENVPIRCLIDQGSQLSYVSEDLVQRLRLKKLKTDVTTFGVGGIAAKVKAMVFLHIQLEDPAKTVLKISALVVPRVTGKLPALPKSIKTANDRKLADPFTYKPTQVPVLIGAKVLPDIFLPGLEIKDGLLYQQTKFGWIVSGHTKGEPKTAVKHLSCHVSLMELDQQLLDFWDMPLQRAEGQELDDEYCEKVFREQHSRTADGRYVVPIPWRPNAPPLGDSYTKAVKFYLGQEYRWTQNPVHKAKSDAFMEEYYQLGHMEAVPKADWRDTSGKTVYINYISVLREDATTTKLRNVFNAAAPTANGVSLNQQILPGPKLQTHIFDAIVRLRKFKYIYSADVTKMFRQILLPANDQKKLRILWRKDRSEPIKEWQMNTVVYGLACSPYQAIRTLHQMADDNAPNEEIKEIIKNGFYMDDLLYGADSIETCQQQIQGVMDVMQAGKMELRKWMSNDKRVLDKVDDALKIEALLDMSKRDDHIKTLGLTFNPREDYFTFKTKPFDKVTYTKRGVLSCCQSIYDVCGWALPVIMHLRMCVQSLWQQGLDWDEPIDDQTKTTFTKGISSLHRLSELRIPRWTGGTQEDTTQLIGFCDASGDGYAAMIYSRVHTSDGWRVQLIAAKGRVTPLKSKAAAESMLCTIPKMELEAIVLLTELFQEVDTHYNCEQLIAYTDSEVALAWVRRLKEATHKVVKNRVNKIRRVLDPANLHYVKSAENPADAASRGLTTDKFLEVQQLWLHGPEWLCADELPLTPITTKEEDTYCCATTVDEPETPFTDKFSSWTRLVRTTAYCLRLRHKVGGALTAEEIATATLKLIKLQQKQSFGTEIQLLQADKSLPKKHWMNSLRPFLDTEGVLRVGGRLANSSLPENLKHPIILGKCHMVDVYIRHLHQSNGHAANTLLERLVREDYFIPGLASRIRKCTRQCVHCRRWAARTIHPQLGQLPELRVERAGAFHSTGVDLAGPFIIRPDKLRFAKTLKAWVVLFVCAVTKAVHLELVTDLSTEAFLQAYQRFVSRRGHPRNMLSDRGTNFVGAMRVIKHQWNTICQEAKEKLAIQPTTWHLSPPGSPNFGGLWESLVKTMKYFIKRMENVEKLTYEEFYTLTCKIELIMNSRPLSPNSVDPTVFAALTPFQLITNRSPRISPLDMKPDRDLPLTKRWLTIYHLQQQFWERFQIEYLSQLHKSYKRKFPARNLKVGELVLLHNHLAPPAAWSMGRITEIHPDKAGSVRVVSIQTANKDKEPVIRAVSRLVPIFPDEEEEVVDKPVQEPTQEPSNEKSKDDESALRSTGTSAEQSKRESTQSPHPTDQSAKEHVPQDVQTLPTKRKPGRPKKTAFTEKPAEVVNKPTPAPRRSPRLQSGSYLSMTTIMTMCCLAMIIPSQGKQIIPVEQGVKVQPIRNASIKAFDLNFQLNTTLNMTADFEVMDRALITFTTYCETFKRVE